MPRHQTIVDPQATVRAARDRYLATLALLGGVVVAPHRVWRAWRRARGGRTLYVDGIDLAAALDMRVVDLRRRLGLPDDGIVARAD